MNKKALLAWYQEAGVDEAVGELAINRLSSAVPEPTPLKPTVEAKPAPALSITTASPAPSVAATSARAIADRCQTLEELKEAVMAFDGCALKKTAIKTVFADGNPNAKIMLIGEAPGAQEDIQGIPFCGPSGLLLDKMLASIGLSRDSIYITNTVFWRPPGNRQPSKEETAICLPLVEKHIALIAPKLIILSGGTATSTLLSQDTSISKLRGKFYAYQNNYLPSEIQTAVTYHPSYLLRTPAQKKSAWADLLMIKKQL
ncbi:MAG: uracil-DNA glycosylase [Rickettsiales bacterium]|jgi:DNA polymerase|nr:uracil-DNA glycosylase [Rickettsiales bacterium]